MTRASAPTEGSTLVTALGDEPLAPLVLSRHLDIQRVVCVGGRPIVAWRVEPLLAMLRREQCDADWLPLDSDDVPDGVAALETVLPTDGHIVFDLTNAHGIVGFALYDVAHRRERQAPDRARLIRIDWSDRVIRPLAPDDSSPQPVEASLQIGEYLELYGKRLQGVERARGSHGRFGPAARRIAHALERAEPVLEAVHRGAWDRPLRIRDGRSALRMAGELADYGLLHVEGRHVSATSLQAFEYLHGRWLEEYLFEIADTSGQFDDAASGVRFVWSPNGGPTEAVANEIDFVGTAGGRATVASCKTGFRDVNAPLYELLTVAERAAGRSVVTVFATSEVLDRHARHRASALGVRVIDRQRLQDESLVLRILLGDGAIPAPVESRRPDRRERRR
ncbi:MAG: DUF1887 family CARF protein [Chloroflexota bacterium]